MGERPHSNTCIHWFSHGTSPAQWFCGFSRFAHTLMCFSAKMLSVGMYTLIPLPLTTGLPSLNKSVPKMSQENTPRAALLEKKKWKSLSRVRLFATSWTIQSMEFSRPEYWSGEPFPSPGYLPNQGSNASLLHCKRILHQLSHKRSPMSRYKVLICLLGAVILAAEGQGLLFSLSVPSSWYSDPYERYFLPVC